MMLVERPVREVVRLFNIEDTLFFDEIQQARDLAKQVVGNVIQSDHPAG